MFYFFKKKKQYDQFSDIQAFTDGLQVTPIKVVSTWLPQSVLSVYLRDRNIDQMVLEVLYFGGCTLPLL